MLTLSTKIYTMFTNKNKICCTLTFCFIIHIKADWIKLHHFTPTQLHIGKTEPVTILDSSKDNSMTPVFKNDSITSDNTILESKIINENESLLFNSGIKENLFETHWVLSQQEDNSLRGKLIFLQKVKQHLLHSIWEQSKTLWNRKTEARSMFGFPSIEGTLTTIAFLTFAVFLIKIVQQFVQGLQGVSPNTIGFQIPPQNGGGGAGGDDNRKARHKRYLNKEIDEVTARIFQYMDEFKIHHKL